MYDYVIVGAGSAGCVLASRLSEDASCSVLLLEAGGTDASLFSRIPGTYSKLQDTEYDWGYRTVPQKHLYQRRIFQPRGKVLGGSSAINYMVYIRGCREDYDHWRALGNEGWGYEEVLPYFVRMEDNHTLHGPFHGTSGPIAVSAHSVRSPLSEKFVEAAQQVGIPLNSDFNGATQDGCGFYQATFRNNERCSAADGYLVPAMGRANLKVVIHAHVTCLLLERSRAIGVRYLSAHEGLQTVHARSEVLLCGGAVNSPQLLMLSGIGPPDQLRRVGIEVRLDLPGVGCNLQDHLSAYVRSATRIGSSILTGPASQHSAAIDEWKMTRRGPLASNFIEAGCFVRAVQDDEASKLQVFIRPALTPDYPEGPRPVRNGLTLSSYLARPRSIGRITLATSNPLDKPLIDPNYLDNSYDARALVASIRLNRRILAARAFADVLEEEISPGIATQDDGLMEYVRKSSSTTWHPVGTCKMGSDVSAVVDDELRVRGVDGLRVVDASIMPTIVSGNTNAATMMIAEKASDMIRGAVRR